MEKQMVSAPAQKKRRLSGKKLRHIQELLCTLPALFFVILLNHYPLVQMIHYSFTDKNLMKKTYKYVGLTNWKWLFTTLETNHVLNAFKVTIIYTVIHVVMIIGGGLLLAFLFNKMTKAFSVMRTIVFMPHYIGMSTAAVVFIWMYNENFGILNYFLTCLGFDRIPWLSSTQYALISILIVTFWKSVGFEMLIYLSAMQGISKDYYEAARLDGANSFQIARKITLPLLGPTTAYLVVTRFISSMKVYNVVDILTGGGPLRSTQVVVHLLYDLTFNKYNVGRSSVVSIVFFFFLLAVTAATMKWSDKKTNYDA